MKKVKQVLVVVPTYNEAENIRPLLAGVEKALAGYQFDVLFVDDNSPDGPAEIVRKLQVKSLNVYLLSGEKEGLGKAYIRGLTYGLKLKKYDGVVTMDADLSHDPADIPRLLNELENGADYVIGSRYVRGGRIDAGYSWLRRAQSTGANFIARYFVDSQTNVKDLTGGFKAIRASRLKTIPLDTIDASGYVFQVGLLYEFAKRGYKIREVPIVFHARQHGQSKLRLRDALEFLSLTFRLNPRARVPRLIRFASVGASGTIVNLVILTGLVKLMRVNVDTAYLVALESSIISNFTLNHLFTFGSVRESARPSTLGKLWRYNAVSFGGVAISFVVFELVYHALGWNYILADLLGIVAAMSWNYWLSVKVVWRIVDSEPELFD